MIASLFSCSKEKDTVATDPARELFEISSSTLLSMIKSVELAKDSAEVDSINTLIEKRLVEINFNFPPETDMKLSEEENDSLYRLMSEFKKKGDERLKDLKKISNDTLTNTL